MKKSAFSVFVGLLCLLATKASAQANYYYNSNHPHQHLSVGIGSVVYDPWGPGGIEEDVYLSVNLDGHTECSIVSTHLSVTIETATDHWTMVDITGSGPTLAHGIKYSMNDDPYWLHYDWEVEYSDGTFESYGMDYYY